MSAEERVAERRREAGWRAGFSAAFDRAERRRAEAAWAGAVKAAERDGQRLEAARAGEAAARRVEGDGDGAARSGGASEPEGGNGTAAGEGAASTGPPAAAPGPEATPGGGAGAAGDAAAPGEAGRAALARAVRALPPVVEAFQATGRAALAIDFGRGLGVELRQVPGGVELCLVAPPPFRPAARLELMGLCRTLASRGVAVVRAEVRGGRPGRGRW